MRTRYIIEQVFSWLKNNPGKAVLVLDAMILPGLCKQLIDVMFGIGNTCKWAMVGAMCPTCGGTHCVQSFLNGDFRMAFAYNQMVFGWILYGIFTVLLLNGCFLLHSKWAGRCLRKMYSLTAFLIGVGIYLGYTLLRNIPLLIELI